MKRLRRDKVVLWLESGCLKSLESVMLSLSRCQVHMGYGGGPQGVMATIPSTGVQPVTKDEELVCECKVPYSITITI